MKIISIVLLVLLLSGAGIFGLLSQKTIVGLKVTVDALNTENEQLHTDKAILTREKGNLNDRVNTYQTQIANTLLFARAQDVFFDIQRFTASTSTTRYGAKNELDLIANLVNAANDTNDTMVKSYVDTIAKGSSAGATGNAAVVKYMLYTSAKITDSLIAIASSSKSN